MVETVRPGTQFASETTLLPKRRLRGVYKGAQAIISVQRSYWNPQNPVFRAAKFRQLTLGRARCKPVHLIEHLRRWFVVVTWERRGGKHREKLAPTM